MLQISPVPCSRYAKHLFHPIEGDACPDAYANMETKCGKPFYAGDPCRKAFQMCIVVNSFAYGSRHAPPSKT